MPCNLRSPNDERICLITLPLPPLTALRAFEAAARTGSYVAAARETGVTATAISQHIRRLEAFLGKQLFVRFNNRIALTDAGEVMFESAHAGLQTISDAIRPDQPVPHRSRVVISCIDSIAQTWLVPQLAHYAASHGEFRFDLRIEPDPVDFSQNRLDLRLAYDPSHYPGYTILSLGADVVLPLCSPAYLDLHPALRTDGMAAVPGEALLTVNWGPSFGSRPGWVQWFAQANLPVPDLSLGSQTSSSAVALNLARQDLGVALDERIMASADLAAGRLIALSEVGVSLRHAYCLVYPRSETRMRDVSGLASWLENQWAADSRC